MKKVTLIFTSMLLLLAGSTTLHSCRKSGSNGLGSNKLKYVIPTSFPTLSSYIQVNDQRTYLAWGLVNAYFNPTVGQLPSSATPIFVNLNSSATKQKVFLTEIVHATSSNSYLQPSTMATPELGDAIQWSIQNVPPSFSLGTSSQFQPAAIIAFMNQAGDKASSYVEIIDYQSLSSIELNRPILFCPRNVDQLGQLKYPVRGYYYNNNTNQMAQEQFLDEDDLEGQVDWLIHWVDYSFPIQLRADATPNCDRPVVCGDAFCDMTCGEDDNNGCPVDCDMLRLKWLQWSEVAVLADWKWPGFCSSTGEKHREQFGCYRIVCEGIIEHANGTRTFLGKTFDVERNKIQLCRKRWINCSNVCNNGGSTVVYPNVLLNDLQKFDPLSSRIYLFFYEYDDAVVGPDDKWSYDYNLTVKTQGGGQWTETFEVRSRHNPFGFGGKVEIPKNGSGPNSVVNDVYSYANPSQAPTYFVVIRPGDWVWNGFTATYFKHLPNLQFKLKIFS